MLLKFTHLPPLVATPLYYTLVNFDHETHTFSKNIPRTSIGTSLIFSHFYEFQTQEQNHINCDF